MALECGFYDSYNGDRLYNAENMNDIFEGLITDGVYAGIGDEFAVRPGEGLQVMIGTGRAWYKMSWNKNRVVTPIDFDQPDPVYDRIDTVCIRVQKNISVRDNDFYIYKGTIGVNATPPILTGTDDVFYLPLANVKIRASATEITYSDITILVGKSQCPYVTSIVQQTDITKLFDNWEEQFKNWWDNIKLILESIESGDVKDIIELLNKIDRGLEDKLDKDDKATEEDIENESDDKWMTPASTKNMIKKISVLEPIYYPYIHNDSLLSNYILQNSVQNIVSGCYTGKYSDSNIKVALIGSGKLIFYYNWTWHFYTSNIVGNPNGHFTMAFLNDNLYILNGYTVWFSKNNGESFDFITFENDSSFSGSFMLISVYDKLFVFPSGTSSSSKPAGRIQYWTSSDGSNFNLHTIMMKESNNQHYMGQPVIVNNKIFLPYGIYIDSSVGYECRVMYTSDGETWTDLPFSISKGFTLFNSYIWYANEKYYLRFAYDNHTYIFENEYDFEKYENNIYSPANGALKIHKDIPLIINPTGWAQYSVDGITWSRLDTPNFQNASLQSLYSNVVYPSTDEPPLLLYFDQNIQNPNYEWNIYRFDVTNY